MKPANHYFLLHKCQLQSTFLYHKFKQ